MKIQSSIIKKLEDITTDIIIHKLENLSYKQRTLLLTIPKLAKKLTTFEEYNHLMDDMHYLEESFGVKRLEDEDLYKEFKECFNILVREPFENQNTHYLIVDLQHQFVFGIEDNYSNVGDDIIDTLKNNKITNYSIVCDTLFLENGEVENHHRKNNEIFYEIFNFLDEEEMGVVYYDYKDYIYNDIYSPLITHFYETNFKPKIIEKQYAYIRNSLDVNPEYTYILSTLKIELDKLGVSIYDEEKLINSFKENKELFPLLKLLKNHGLNEKNIVDKLEEISGLDFDTIHERYSCLNKEDKIILMGGDGCQCLMEEYISLNLLGFHVEVDENNMYTYDITQYYELMNMVYNQQVEIRKAYSIENKLEYYEVGGCVRDELLGLIPKDRDYVVVNSSEKEMLELGFKKVGADFNVFLHPITGDEYALARIERSTGSGYNDFETIVNNVSLEDDLKRRDLTINAIAKDKEGNYYDPFNGKSDLKNKVLKHVSDAFKEDPLRILRIARFKCRYNDFSIADDTQTFIKGMIDVGMIDSLTKERILKEFEKACDEKKPSIYFKTLQDLGAFSIIYPHVSLNEKTLNTIDTIVPTLQDKELKAMTTFLYLHKDISSEALNTLKKENKHLPQKWITPLEVNAKIHLFETLDSLNSFSKQNFEKCCVIFNNFKLKGMFDLNTLIEIGNITPLQKEILEHANQAYKNVDVKTFMEKYIEKNGKEPNVEAIQTFIKNERESNWKKVMKSHLKEEQTYEINKN